MPDVRTYSYDPGRRLATRTDQAGVVTTYAYDAANRLISRAYSNATPGDTFAYDRAGRLVQAAAGASGIGVTRTYDSAGRLTQEAQFIEGIPFPVTYGYDAAGRQTQMTYPDGTVVDRPVTARGRLAGESMAGQDLDRRTYDAAGLEGSKTGTKSIDDKRSTA